MFSQRNWLNGSALIFLGEALSLPTGLVTAAFLSRQFGPAGYGYLVLAATLVSWVEWSVTSLFSRASFKLLSEQENWRPFAVSILRLHFLIGAACAGVFWVSADWIAGIVNEPELAKYLKLFALDIPVFCLARGYRNVFISTGRFKPRASAAVIYWIGRLFFVIFLVWLGYSIAGAIAGIIAASVIELAIAVRWLKLPIWRQTSVPLGTFWRYSVLLFWSATARRIYQRADLLALKIFNGSAAQAGFYGAAQNLLMLSTIFMTSISPLLISTVSNMLSKNRHLEAQSTARNALRLALGLLPLAAIVAGSVHEIVPFVFGSEFTDAAPVFQILIFSEIAAILISLSTALMVAKGFPNWSLFLNAALILLVLPGYWHFVPQFEMIGAASVTTGGSLIGAIAGMWLVSRLMPGIFPLQSLFRSAIVTGICFWLSEIWVAEAWQLLIELPVLGVLAGILFVIFGEISPKERRTIVRQISVTFGR